LAEEVEVVVEGEEEEDELVPSMLMRKLASGVIWSWKAPERLILEDQCCSSIVWGREELEVCGGSLVLQN